ncbi:MAG: hypothetical protein IJW77_16020 [Clostridia bacterium]|nr:hypothetical protein [Clostridia bacterium]
MASKTNRSVSILLAVVFLCVTSCGYIEIEVEETETVKVTVVLETEETTESTETTIEIEIEETTELTETTEIIKTTETEADNEELLKQVDVTILGEYRYDNLPEIEGQASNPEIFTTKDPTTPFLSFGEDGFEVCEVEITEYPVSLTLGGVTVSDVYREYSYAGEVFYPDTQTGGGLLAGALFDADPDRHELRAIHKVGDEIICELTHCGVHDLVIYHIGHNSFTALHSGQSLETAFYDTQGQLRTLPCYVTGFFGMSPMRDYMIYAVSEQYGKSDMDYYLYQFSTKTATLVCDEGFAADSYYGGSAGESAYWLDDRTCRIDLETDFGKGIHEFYDIFVADDSAPQIKAYPKEEARAMALDQNDSLYRLCYRFDFNDDGGVISHLYDDSYSVTSTGLTRESFYQLFDKGESYSDFFGHSLNNGYQAKAIGENFLFQHFLIYSLYDIHTWTGLLPELGTAAKQIYPLSDGFLVVIPQEATVIDVLHIAP